LSDEHL
jgi:hypothetical protein